MDFYKRAELVCRQIPYGKVATYGQIALLCGKPRNSRQVGYALNHRVTGEDIPAHRVVNAKGYLSGAAAFRTPGLQRELLEAEGVEVLEDLTVNLQLFGWNHTLELALQLRESFDSQGI